MKKGQSHIFLAILILMIGLVLIAVLALWLPEITFEIYPEEAYNKTYLRSRACLGIEEVDGLFGLLSIRNCGQVPLTNLKFFMDSARFDLDIEKLDPQESKFFYDLPIIAGNHTVVVTADYAESPPRFIDVPPYVCIEGVPLKREDWDITERTGTWPPASGNWVITDTTSCVCSYNSNITVTGLVVEDKGNFSIERCLLYFYNPIYPKLQSKDNATVTISNSTVDSNSYWNPLSFYGNSTNYMNYSNIISNVIVHQSSSNSYNNSNFGWYEIISNMPHNLTIIDLHKGENINNYIETEGSNFKINFINTSVPYIRFTGASSSNNTIINSTLHQITTQSSITHNVNITNFRRTGGVYVNNYIEAEGSNFRVHLINVSGITWRAFTEYYTNTIHNDDSNNNVIINSPFESFSSRYEMSTYNITNSTFGGTRFYTIMLENNLSANITDSDIGSVTLGWIYYDSAKINLTFENSTANNWNIVRVTDSNIKGNLTITGSVTGWDRGNITRYFPTIVKYANGNPVSGTVYVADKFGNRVWNGNIINSYTEPETLFDFNNYGPGNLTLYLIDDYEYEFISTDMPFLKNTPINLTIPYCDVFIPSLPYTITESNTYYCLPVSYSFIVGTAISFSSGVQNSTLNCMYNTIDGDDSGTDYGVYLIGTNTKNNAIKNCKITGFDSGILIESSSNTTLFSNSVYNNNYGIQLKNSIDNTLMRGSIHDNNYDYYLQNVETTNYFRDSNFTNSRKIKFEDEKSWFNYNNDTIETTVSNLWLKTNVSSSTTITRKLINWNQSTMQWNDTSDLDTIARYNIIGLIPNIKYYVYDNDIFKYTLTTDHSGDLESFIIDLPASEEHEIKVKIICDYLIFNSDIPYTITENNKYYCLLSDSFDISDQIAITFASGVQNLTLDCLNHIIDGIDTDDTYGIYSEQYNTTVKNCILTDFYDGIYLRFSDYNILTNITANSNYAGIELYYSDNNIIINSAFNSNDYGIRLSTSSDNNIITDNNINSNSERGVYIWDNSNNTITGGSIASNINSDYYLYSAGTTNNFISTNFTAPRKIRFSTTTSWFNYRNDIAINIWLKTNVSNTNTISRELISWSQSLMQWNDTSDEQTTARYNITGLISNTNYYVYNNSVSTYSLNSGDNGKISFIINLPQNEEHEIKVNTTS